MCRGSCVEGALCCHGVSNLTVNCLQTIRTNCQAQACHVS